MREQFASLIQRDDAAGEVVSEVAAEHLVDPADTRPIAAEPLKGEQRPERLDGFSEGSRRLVGNAAQGLCDRLELLPLRRVGGGCRHQVDQIRVTLLPAAGGVEADEHGLKEVPSLLVQVRGGQTLLDPLADRAVA